MAGRTESKPGPARAVEVLTSQVLPAPAPAAPAPAPAPAPVDDGLLRCCHGRYAIDPCADCGRRYVAGELVGGFVGG